MARMTPRFRFAQVTLTRLVVGTLLAAASAAAQDAPAPAPSLDPVEGRWWGTITAPHETAEVGLEIRRGTKGTLQATITQPGANYFGLALPGEVRREGERVTLPEIGLGATLTGDRMSGTFGQAQVPIELRRVESFPGPAPIPPVPTGPGPRWQTRLGGQIFASPVIADGVAYVGTTSGYFDAVRIADGSVVWSFEAGRPVFGAAGVDGDAVYFTCDNGYLFRLDRATGEERWRYDLGDSRVSRALGHPGGLGWDWHGPRPLVADGVVYVGAGDGGFHAVDAATGTGRWRAETGGRIRGGAALAGDLAVVGSADRFVYAFDRASGREVWKHDSEAEIEDEPLVADGRVFVGNRGIGLIALDVTTGERLWRTTFWGSWVESTPTLADGVLYIGSSDLSRVSAIDPVEGTVLWRTQVHGWTFGTPLAVGERIYAGAAGGTPYFVPHVASFNVLDRATGRLLERWPLPDSPDAHQWGIAGSLALAGDTIVATTIGGSIYGFPVR